MNKIVINNTILETSDERVFSFRLIKYVRDLKYIYRHYHTHFKIDEDVMSIYVLLTYFIQDLVMSTRHFIFIYMSEV